MRTVHGEVFATVEEERRIANPSHAYQNFTTLNDSGFFYSNIKSLEKEENKHNILDLWIKFDEVPNLEFHTKEEHAKGYLPLLVERGPPGCNLNYPISSILYPKTSQPFLANYPYPLTFRNLHSKFMKIEEVTIQRTGDKKNVNEIQEGFIYFTNDSKICSKKYPFSFKTPEEGQIVMEINEPNYWKFMVVEPLFNMKKNLPF